MAVWGAPVAHEDDAERAVRAGLELVDAVPRPGPGIQARAGVLTGEAAVTLGRVEPGAWSPGDLVNTAARLQSVAPPGTVLVGEATRRAAAAAIAFEPAGEQLLKGKASPVPGLARAAGRRRARRRGRTETLEAPFVGRDDELRLLKDLLPRDRARAAGAARLGHRPGRHRQDAGSPGSSRKYLDGLVEEVWWHDGRSPAYGDGISFWALGEMIRPGRACSRATTSRRPGRGSPRCSRRHVPDEDERRWIEPALLALLGIERGRRQRAAVRRLADVLRAARRDRARRPRVRGPPPRGQRACSTSSTQLVDWSRALADLRRHAGAPGAPRAAPDWGAGKRSFTSLHLEPLAEPAMRELLAGLVPGLPEAAVRPIVARADGIPLYAVETVRMLLAEGRLERARRRRTCRSATSATLAVPETLTALIASRLDGLDPADHAPVSDASVLGSLHVRRAGRRVGPAGGRPRAAAPGARPPRDPRPSQPIRARPSGASTPSSRRSSARSPTTRWRRRIASRATSPPPATSRALGATSSRAPSPATTSPPRRTPRRARSATRSPARRGSPSGGRPSVPRRSARTSRRSPSSSRPSRSRRIPAPASSCSRGWGTQPRRLRATNSRNCRSSSRRRSPGRPAIGPCRGRGRGDRRGARVLAAAGRRRGAAGTSRRRVRRPARDPGVLAIRSQLARALHFLEAYRESLAILEQVLPIAERDDHTALLADRSSRRAGHWKGGSVKGWASWASAWMLLARMGTSPPSFGDAATRLRAWASRWTPSRCGRPTTSCCNWPGGRATGRR